MRNAFLPERATRGVPRVVTEMEAGLLSHSPGPTANSRDYCPDDDQFSVVSLAETIRVVFLLTPPGRGTFREQASGLFAVLKACLRRQQQPAVITSQTIFLRRASDQQECEIVLQEFFGSELPITNYAAQAPCCGAGLAVEAWTISGPGVQVERHGREMVAVTYDGLRWVHCGGIRPASGNHDTYAQALQAFQRTDALLRQAGSRFRQVVRTWFYLGGITKPEKQTTRYQQFNRARNDFYDNGPFVGAAATNQRVSDMSYPASTGIGTVGDGLIMSCLALETSRTDVRLVPLENPRQTPAYAYPSACSPQRPTFSRAMALVTGDYVTIWISGTASIRHFESCHPGDICAQTEQTIDNIEQLIGVENFQASGLSRTGAGLDNLAKIRVYLKRADDYAKCRGICDRRFGSVPAIYVVADICRPELLVEIEGVAFSRLRK